MHLRYALAVAGALSLVAILILRMHLRDIAEVVSTYSQFYSYLGRYPDSLYRYSAASPIETPATASALVPPILHRIFLAEDNREASLAHYENEIRSCNELHTNWTSHVWNDTAADDFMLKNYPDLFPHYKGYRQRIQRANVLRYALLHHYGGVYLDLDITCLQPLEHLRTLPWLTPGAHPAGVNNAFIASRPQHPLLELIITKLPSRDMRWGLPYVENMLSTGCMYFSNRWMEYARTLERKDTLGEAIAAQDNIYVLGDESGDLGPHMLRGAVTTPLFQHAGASSWHGWDASAFLLIGDHYGYVLLLVGAVLLVALARVGLRGWQRRALRRQRSLSPRKRSPRYSSWSSDDEEKQLDGHRVSADSRSSFFSLRRNSSFPLPRTE